jgi:hypothetical protein
LTLEDAVAGVAGNGEGLVGVVEGLVRVIELLVNCGQANEGRGLGVAMAGLTCQAQRPMVAVDGSGVLAEVAVVAARMFVASASIRRSPVSRASAIAVSARSRAWVRWPASR